MAPSVNAAGRIYSERELRSLGIYFVEGGSNAASCASDATAAAPGLASGSKIYILGDSITSYAESTYKSAFLAKGITAVVDASGGRSLVVKGAGKGRLTNGMEAIAADAADIKAADAIVVGLGTNGDNSPASIDAAIDALRNINTNTKTPIYWIDTTVIDRAGGVNTIKNSNAAIYSESKTKSYQIISWFKAVSPTSDPENITGTETDTNGYIVNGDQHVHPTGAGITALTNLVVQQTTSAATNNSSCVGTTVTGSVNGTGSCYQLALPKINDQAALAKAIDDYIKAKSPKDISSPFIGLGADFVQGAVRNGVNPMFEVANVRQESQFGTTGLSGHGEVSALLHQHYNAFGRTSNASQPHFAALNGRLWYAYPSWKDSLNSPGSSATQRTDQPSLMRGVYLDQGVNTIAEYVHKYAPGSDGNNEGGYGKSISDVITGIVGLAGSSLSCTDTATNTTPAVIPKGVN